MAYGDYEDLYKKALRNARRQDDDATEILRGGSAVNRAYLGLMDDDIPWDFLEAEGTWTVTAGQDKYTFTEIETALSITAGTLREPLHIGNKTRGGRLILPMDWAELENSTYSSQDGDANGEPSAWAYEYDFIRFWRTPDQAYDMFMQYRQQPAVMTTTTDEPLLPLSYRDSFLVPQAAAYLWRERSGDEALRMARAFQEDADRAYERLLRSHGSPRGPERRFMAPDYGQNLPGGPTLNPYSGGGYDV